MKTRHTLLAIALLFAAAARDTAAQTPAGAVLDDSLPPGASYDKAQFRLWYPSGVTNVQAVLVLMPGSNGDGRPMAQDTVWQAFAARNKLAIIACRFTDKPHEQAFIEDYINVSKGAGDALLTALSSFAAKSGHAEVANAPLLLWGMSAGGQFNYEFVAWKPERVVAFAVNKGGIYYSALLPRAARQVPGMLFTGGKDLESRKSAIAGLFALNRRGGALWAFAEEPAVGHVIGRSRDVSMVYFEEVLPLRIAEGSRELKPLTEKTGFTGDLKAKTYQAIGDARVQTESTVWLPTERAAKAWLALVTETPFDR